MQPTRYLKENLIIDIHCEQYLFDLEITPTFLTTFKKASPESLFNSLENIGHIENNETSTAKVRKTEPEVLDTVAKNPEEEHGKGVKDNSDSENELAPKRNKERRPSESLAERAKSISRTHLTKLKSNLSVEDLAKFVPGFHPSGYDSDNTSESAIRLDSCLNVTHAF